MLFFRRAKIRFFGEKRKKKCHFNFFCDENPCNSRILYVTLLSLFSTLTIMANKRTLKQTVNQICEMLFAECVAASLYDAAKHPGHAEDILFCIVKLQRDYTARISHPEPGMPPKQYYATLKEKFREEAHELLDQITNL